MSNVTGASIVFRPDASFSVGSGHVIRCLALATALRELGAQCAVAATRQALDAVPALPASGNTILHLADDKDPRALAEIMPENVDWLVVDHYGLGSDYHAACRPWAKLIMAIDDVPCRSHACDLLLDQTLDRQATDYTPWVPSGSKVLTGTAYALLRPAFAAKRQQAMAKKHDPLRRILVSFGGGNPDGITERVTRAVAERLPDVTLDVVIGSHWPEAADLAARLSMMPSVVVHCDPPNMAELMLSADLAIGAAGSMSWERCALALPSVLIIAADNQADIASRLGQAGAAWIETPLTAGTEMRIADAVAYFNDAPSSLDVMAQRASKICDGAGAGRTAAVMLSTEWGI